MIIYSKASSDSLGVVQDKIAIYPTNMKGSECWIDLLLIHRKSKIQITQRRKLGKDLRIKGFIPTRRAAANDEQESTKGLGKLGSSNASLNLKETQQKPSKVGTG
jgi:hypothetical protein